jgi:ribose/xylose/arabinose/galactoside ABC-type transport system permease subunit
MNNTRSQSDRRNSAKLILKNFFLSRQFLLIIVIIIIVSMTASQSDAFFTMANISGVLFYFSVYSIIAMGLLVLFISGGFDMSIGTHLSFIGVILGILLGNKVPVPLAILITK